MSVPEGSPASDVLVTGWLREHGDAPHEFRPRAEPSYYLRLDTREGPRILWGPGLKRAVERARTKPQPGDEIGVRHVEITPVGTTAATATPRSYWIVERKDFFAERLAAAQALRDPRVSPRAAVAAHPDLLGAYFALDSARKVAEARIAHPDSRERFVALVRETLAHATERGEPLPIASPKRSAASIPRRARGDDRSR